MGYLSRAGYRIVARNVRFRGGEIDIVAHDGSCLVFVEVKCRRSNKYGTPEDSLTAHRFALFERAAYMYLEREGLHDVEVRLEVVALVVGPDGTVARVNHIQGVEAPVR